MCFFYTFNYFLKYFLVNLCSLDNQKLNIILGAKREEKKRGREGGRDEGREGGKREERGKRGEGMREGRREDRKKLGF